MNPQAIRDAAEQLAAALKQWEPERMHDLVRDMPALADSLNSVADGYIVLFVRPMRYLFAPRLPSSTRTSADFLA